jgi:hypothetical protein
MPLANSSVFYRVQEASSYEFVTGIVSVILIGVKFIFLVFLLALFSPLCLFIMLYLPPIMTYSKISLFLYVGGL